MPDRDNTKGLGQWARASAGDSLPDPKDGDQTPDPEGQNVIAFVPITFSNLIRDLQRAFMNQHRCNNLHKCLNADLVDGQHWTDIQDWVNTQIAAIPAADHGALSGLADDDHPQYLLIDGSRAMTGILEVLNKTDPSQPSIVTTDADTGIAIDGTNKEIRFIIDGTAELTVGADKVTIPGLLDPTGVMFTEQVGSPAPTAAGEALIYIKNLATQPLVFQDDNGDELYVAMFDDAHGNTDNEIPRKHSSRRGELQGSNLRIRDTGTYYTDDATIEAFGGSKGRNVGLRGGLWSGSSANAGDVYIDGGAHSYSGLTGSRSGDVHINAGTVVSASRGTVYLSDLVATPVQIGSASFASTLQIYERASAPGNVSGLVRLFTINSAPNTMEAQDDQGGVSYVHARHNINRAYRATTFQTIANITWTKVQLNAESFDLEGTFDSTTNYRFTPNVAGYYQVNWNVEYGQSVDEGVSYTGEDLLNSARYWSCTSAIYKNGSIYARGSSDAYLGGGTYSESADMGSGSHGSAIVYLNGSTDYVELYGYRHEGAGGSIAILPDSDMTYMSATLINKK